MDFEMIILFVNIAILVILLINIVRCWIKGFLMSLWECFGTLLALVLAWNIAPYISPLLRIFPMAWTPMAGTPLAPAINETLNGYAWILVLFLLIKLILALIKPFIKVIEQLPVIKQLNHVVGGAFGVVITWFWCLLAIFTLSIPVFKQGNDIVKESVLQPVKTISIEIVGNLGDVIEQNELLGRVLSGDALDQEDQKKIEEWLKENNISEDVILEYFNIE